MWRKTYIKHIKKAAGKKKRKEKSARFYEGTEYIRL
jgi:uncharacterized C2H2 Zn-finger protein